MKTSPRQAHNVSFRMAKPPNKELVCRFGHLLQPGLIHLWLAPVWVIICVNWFLIQVILFSIASCGKPLARYAGIRPSGSVMDSTLSKSVWNQPIQNFFLFSLISPWARDKYGIGVFSFGFCRIKKLWYPLVTPASQNSWSEGCDLPFGIQSKTQWFLPMHVFRDFSQGCVEQTPNLFMKGTHILLLGLTSSFCAMYFCSGCVQMNLSSLD